MVAGGMIEEEKTKVRSLDIYIRLVIKIDLLAR